MEKYKVTVSEDCIGCSACLGVCSNFELKDGKAKPKKSEVYDIGCNQDAVDICPVKSIKIEVQKIRYG